MPAPQDHDDGWRQLAATLNAALPQIDLAFSAANVPLHERGRRATEWFIAGSTNIKGEMWKEFIVSEAYVRILALANDWYHTRYGSALEHALDRFPAAISIFNSPFLFDVPTIFSKPGEEKETVWIGFQDNVQPEEDPLKWIKNGPNIDKLEATVLEQLKHDAMSTANAIRSLNYDLKAISHDTDAFGRDLAASIGANLKASAPDLCAYDVGRLRNAGWQISQASEMTLKLAIHRCGAKPQKVHELDDLAYDLEKLLAVVVDRETLGAIPSGKKATDLRYGGEFSLADGMKAYASALTIIKAILLAVTAKSPYNTRNARFLITTSLWSKFDTRDFVELMKTPKDAN